MAEHFNLVEVAPYWNVNRWGIGNTLSFDKVEVAPYWNVNGLSELFYVYISIGRSSSILECKLVLEIK